MKHHIHHLHKKFTERSPQGVLIRIFLYVTVGAIIFSGMNTYADEARAALDSNTNTLHTPSENSLMTNPQRMLK